MLSYCCYTAVILLSCTDSVIWGWTLLVGSEDLMISSSPVDDWWILDTFRKPCVLFVWWLMLCLCLVCCLCAFLKSSSTADIRWCPVTFCGNICWTTCKSSTHCGKMSILSRRDPQYWMSQPFLRAVCTESHPSAANDISAVLASRRVRRPSVSSQGCTRWWMRLFILASGQRECPDQHLSSPLISTADRAFQELQIECLNPVRPRFSLLWPPGAELAWSVVPGLQVFESAGVKIGNCTTANREKHRFILLSS